ncbi:MAG TPA: DUF3180 domain-containing protein [Actinomycetes bacterium]
MRATTWRLLVAIALVSGVLSWTVLRVWTNDTGDLPEVPWPTAVVIALFGVSVLFSALLLRPRIRHKEGTRPVEPLVSARFGVLSLASSRAGALFIGVYGGFLANALTDLTVDYRRHIALVSGLCVLAAGVLVAAGLVLERICRLPPPDPDA